MEIDTCVPGLDLVFKKFSVPFQIVPRWDSDEAIRYVPVQPAVEVSVVPLPSATASARTPIRCHNIQSCARLLVPDPLRDSRAGHRTTAFDRELSPIFIDDDQKMRPTRSPTTLLFRLPA